MMYTTAALAMILPLLDLHCGKKACDLTEQTFKAENNKFSKYNTEFKSYNSIFESHNSVLKSYNSTLESHNKDLEGHNNDLTTQVEKLENAVTSGVASDLDMDKLIAELTGTKGNAAPGSIYDEIYGSSHEASIKSRIEAIHKRLPTAKTGGSGTIDPTNDIMPTAGALAAVKTDIVDNTQKFLKVKVTLASGGKEWTIDRDTATECVSTSTTIKAQEYTMCCNKTHAPDDVRVYSYSPKAGTRSYDQAKTVCERLGGGKHVLCPPATYAHMANTTTTGTYGGSDKTMTGYSKDTDYTLDFEAVADDYEVWTNVAC